MQLRVRMDLAYDGTAFAGWAVQPGQRTVQAVLEDALRTLARAEVGPRVTVAGRTDAGVHARGQVGYGVRPSARGRGVATWALGEMLSVVREVGLMRVLVVCSEDNIASGRVIERCGGVLADVCLTDLGTARRYWIDLNAG
mgnify:CR=1 FL=1